MLHLVTKDQGLEAILTRVAAGANITLDPGKESHVPQEVSSCFHCGPGISWAGFCHLPVCTAHASVFADACLRRAKSRGLANTGQLGATTTAGHKRLYRPSHDV